MDDEASCCAALLHDVVEDTSVTLDDLRKDFPEEIVEAVGLPTHEESVPMEEYLIAIRENPIALKVKLADNAHNADQTRCCCGNVSEEKLAQWREKYAKARAILLSE
jgi:(p)ppGpp synthase/HD superfamily hydrolase